MGRKKLPERPPPRPAGHDPALLEAVKAALAALPEAGKAASPSAIEEWIKTNRYDVWAAITKVSALKEAIEAANREESNGRAPATAKGASEMGRKKKSEPVDLPPEQATRPEPARTSNAGDQGPSANGPARGTNGARPRRRVKRDEAPPRPTAPRKPRQPVPETAAQERPAPPSPAAARHVPRPSAAPEYDPTRSELLRVLEIARQESSVSRLRKMVQTVKQLADQVGGLDRLAVCLDTLEEFGLK